MISPIQPSPSYDPQNEAQFRTQIREEFKTVAKTDEPIFQLLMLDSVSGEIGSLKIVSGVPTWTVINP